MEIHKVITGLLNITDDAYWERYLQRYMNWITKHVVKHVEISNNGTEANPNIASVACVCPVDFQMLLANTAISIWYSRFHEDIELQAIAVLKHQQNLITTTKMRELYETMMVDIFANYPKPLFDAARELTILNDPRNHDHNAN